MANGEDDDVIHLASFNLHRSQGRRARRRAFITISDDSDEEALVLVQSGRVLVPDEPDDDVRILEPSMAPVRRRMIRPAASWTRSSGHDRPISGRRDVTEQSTASSGATPAVTPPTPPLSRDAQTNTTQIRPLIRAQTLPQPIPSTSTNPQPVPSTSTNPQPVPSTSTNPQPVPSTSTNPQLVPSTSTNPQLVPSTSTNPQPVPSTSTNPQLVPSTSTNPQPVPSTSTNPQLVPSTSTNPQPVPSTSTNPQLVPSTSTNPQLVPSTSTNPQLVPSTSTNPQPVPSTSTQPLTAPPTEAVVLTETQPSPLSHPRPRQVLQQARLIWGPQVHLRAQAPVQAPLAEPQVVARPQALQLRPPLQPCPAPQPRPQGPRPSAAMAPTVLIAAAPERLGPPETGHRITLGSQAAAGTQPNPNTQDRAPQWGQMQGAPPLEPQVLVVYQPVPNLDPVATVSNSEGANPGVQPNAPALALGPALTLAPNAPALVPAPNPPAPAALPRLEEERPGPSAPRWGQGEERPVPPHVRALVQGVLDLLPDVQENYVAELILQNDIKDLNVVCNMLLENPGYPQRESTASSQSSILLEASNTDTQVSEDLFDYSRLGPVGPETLMQAADLLMGDFRMLSCIDIKWALNALKGHYALTRKALCEALKKWQEVADPSGKKRRRRDSSERCYIDFLFEHGSAKFSKRMFFLEKDRRGCRTFSTALEPSLQKEVSFYQQKTKEQAEHEDFLLALQVNEEQYEKDGQLIECGCCCGEFAFEKMTQCSDGHLFCKECLVKYAQEAVFGSGRLELSCMEGGCPCSFPVCELEKVLPESILGKYYERQAEEAVAATCADELVRCPSCHFPALLDPGVSLFSCPNPRCRKESCRKCHVQWKQHVGKSCDQVLERDEIRMRVLFEERMTAARVRKCVKCGTGLVKSEGCNRMWCRCGSFMCYLCREPICGYNHFCQHARSPGAPCRQCRKCSLWTDPTQDDERIIQEIQKEGETELNKKSAENSAKRVGPPAAKQPRIGPPVQIGPAPPLPPAVRAPLLVPPQVVPPQVVPPQVVPPQVLPPAPPQARLLIPLYVPPNPHLRPFNYNINNNVELNLPMHYGPPQYYRRF
ncbi:E3 ubiquitin-protein ligase RNF216 [Hypomesus transpacificus]|uniref:E3 ubiquitin-protein ligase RNF216 n=1 Tax=Hypomesus transpacificus TaxID=137520 RepID=UPI001F085033|nr:E3 ubiquitin-protein ligase RNF216 [Hypomesus transpacificus]